MHICCAEISTSAQVAYLRHSFEHKANCTAACDCVVCDTGIPAAVDPNEPVYCYCQRVSFGEMIACDNEECAIEWFHFDCVGLTPENRPKGKWFCKECIQLQQAGK